MRKTSLLFALIVLLSPLAAFAAAPSPDLTPSGPGVIAQLLTPQELLASAGATTQFDTFLTLSASGTTISYPASWVCSISCTPCSGIRGVCAKGNGNCVPQCP